MREDYCFDCCIISKLGITDCLGIQERIQYENGTHETYQHMMESQNLDKGLYL